MRPLASKATPGGAQGQPEAAPERFTFNYQLCPAHGLEEQEEEKRRKWPHQLPQLPTPARRARVTKKGLKQTETSAVASQPWSHGAHEVTAACHPPWLWGKGSSGVKAGREALPQKCYFPSGMKHSARTFKTNSSFLYHQLCKKRIYSTDL